MKIRNALAQTLIVVTLFASFPMARALPIKNSSSAQEQEDAKEKGWRFRLSEAQTENEPRPTPERIALASALSDEETQKLLVRLPQMQTDADDKQDFKLRERSLPPPRVGETINAAFSPPQPDAKPSPEIKSGALEVVRFAPEGEVVPGGAS